MRVRDQAGRTFGLPRTPKRIVSLVPSQTELLAHLGLEQQLVGVTKFCVHPVGIRKRCTVVGGTKKVHYHKVRDLEPDLIVCNKEENTREMVAELEQIAPVWVSDVGTFDQAIDMIGQLGGILGKIEQAGTLAARIRDRKDSFLLSQPAKKPLKALYLIWNKPLMAAGKGTFIDQMLRFNNLENVVKENRYPEIGKAQIAEADVILLSSEPFPFGQKHMDKFVSAYGKKCLLVDGEYFSWYGSRMLEAFDYFRELQDQMDQ